MNINIYKTTCLIVGFVSLSLFTLTGCSQSEADQVSAKADVVTIDAMFVFGELDRQPVLFPHDLHTRALTKQQKDCSVCHLSMDNGRLSQKFLRLTNDNKETVMELYHDKCIECHNQNAELDIKAGPRICGECHTRDIPLITSRQPVSFDKSMHQRHIEANNSCGNCHHQYNEKTGKLFYAKGEESSCRDCHLEENVDNVSSFEEAAHYACIGCHQISKRANPTECTGCHGLEQQAAFKQIENPPRLQRGQPDFILLSASDADMESSKLQTVPFSHIGHEGFNNNCRVCHHKSMNACNDCHTLSGCEEGDGITLERAMHDMSSTHNCVGCHNIKKNEPECAGCHSLIGHGEQPEQSCTICHAGPKPDKLKAEGSKYKSLDDFRPKSSDIKLSFTEKDIPEYVTVSLIADKYKPVVFPHRRIIDNLMTKIQDNKIAAYFHGHEDVVCQGCHHNSPVSKLPPSCNSCHSNRFSENEPFKPGLQGAYHQQCLGCHQDMKVSEPSDCNVCHKK
ncbi:MAG: cytochrome c3 family protein [Candidatus Hatepunaea meridiana]|nr:cytochrome c3 family protein [Candidatus Hatepunaea meridiana]